MCENFLENEYPRHHSSLFLMYNEKDIELLT